MIHSFMLCQIQRKSLTNTGTIYHHIQVIFLSTYYMRTHSSYKKHELSSVKFPEEHTH